MKTRYVKSPGLRRVVAAAECPYCGHVCTYSFDGGNSETGVQLNHNVCDHCVEYGAYEFVFTKKVNGLQKLQEISNERRQDNKKD